MSFLLCLQEASYLLSSHGLHWGEEGGREGVSEGECVFEREREWGRTERESARICRTDCSSFPFLSPHAHSPRRSCDLVAPSVGPLCQRVSTEHAQSFPTVTPLHSPPPNWKTPTANEDPNHHPKAAYPTRIRGKSLNNQHVQTILYSCIHAKFTYSIYTYFVIPFIVSYKNNKSSRQ